MLRSRAMVLELTDRGPAGRRRCVLQPGPRLRAPLPRRGAPRVAVHTGARCSGRRLVLYVVGAIARERQSHAGAHHTATEVAAIGAAERDSAAIAITGAWFAFDAAALHEGQQ